MELAGTGIEKEVDAAAIIKAKTQVRIKLII